MTTEVYDANGDGGCWYFVAPDALQTRSPFQDLFPVDPALLETVTGLMRAHGFDLSKPINVWRRENIVIDGHTRLKAAIAAKIDCVPICYHEFEDEDEALCYAVSNQRDRRNMTGADILRCVEVVDRRKKSGERTDLASRDARSGKSAAETADIVGVSPATVERARTVIDAADEEPDIKQEVLEGRKSINAAAREVRTRKREKTPSHTPVTPDGPPTSTPAIVSTSEEEQAWLESLPIRPQVVTDRFDKDALTYRYFKDRLEAIRDEAQEIRCRDPEYGGIFLEVLSRVVVLLDPSDSWSICEGCQGTGQNGSESCQECWGGGYKIPL
jgi:hypothetical protein